MSYSATEEDDLEGRAKVKDSLEGALKGGNTFAGAQNASTILAWTFRPAHQANASFAPSPLKLSASASPSTTKHATSYTSTSSLTVRDLIGSTIHNTVEDLHTLIIDTNILRVHVALDELPFAFLDSLHTLLQREAHMKEVHLCIQSLLRPFLQAIIQNIGLERGLIATIRKWASSDATLRFSFLASDSNTETFANHQEVDLLPAIRGLAKGSAALDEILARAERRTSSTQPAHLDGMEHGDLMDLDKPL